MRVIVDQHVDRSYLRLAPLKEQRYVVHIGQVRFVRRGDAAVCANGLDERCGRLLLHRPVQRVAASAGRSRLLQLLGGVATRLPMVRHEHHCTFSGECQCRRGADAMIRSGHKHDFILQSGINHRSL